MRLGEWGGSEGGKEVAVGGVTLGLMRVLGL